MTLFFDAVKQNGLWPDNLYLILNSLPMYTYLGCGVCYELFVVTLMLKLKRGNNQRSGSFESNHSNASYNYENIKYWVLLSMKVFLAIIMLAYLLQVIIYWNCKVNQLNKIIIVVLYILVGLVQLVSMVIFLKETRQTLKIWF